jgi:hypothetical protein
VQIVPAAVVMQVFGTVGSVANVEATLAAAAMVTPTATPMAMAAQKNSVTDKMLNIRAERSFDVTPPFTQKPPSQTGRQNQPTIKLATSMRGGSEELHGKRRGRACLWR